MHNGQSPEARRRRRGVFVAALTALLALLLVPAAAHAAAPSITSINPTSGPISGNTVVTVTGSGLTNADTVTFGGIAGHTLIVLDDQHLTIHTPPAFVVGQSPVMVHTPLGGWSSSNAVFFTYTPGSSGPTVTGVFPGSGPTSGGNSVTVTGTNFTNVTSVTFGGVPGGFVVANLAGTQLSVIAPAHTIGTVHVQVNTSTGSSNLTAADQYTYTTGALAPIITSVSPNSGPTIGGTTVLIYGSGFLATTAVTFDGVGASFVVNSDLSITAISPAHPAGTINVQVLGTNGGSAATVGSQFTYTGTSIPIVSGISPISGPVAGGTTVTISGANFSAATSVVFGISPAAFTILSDNTIQATSPAHSAGTVDVRVSNVYGTSTDTLADNFTYVGTLPVISSVSPSSGPTAGGTIVTILGSGFTADAEVDFGLTPAASVTVVSSTQITATSPAHAAGTVYVTVTTAAGTSVTTSVGQFTYTSTAVTITYNLGFRWTLIVWHGKDGVTIAAATTGTESPDNPATNNVSTLITVIARWNVGKQGWEYAFPPQLTVPGANDFLTLEFERAYFVAIVGPGSITWTTLQN